MEQFLSFFINHKTYLIPSSKVKEVTESTKVSPVPRSFEAITGLINLRGQLATVICLRRLLGLPNPQKDSPNAVYIVCHVDKMLISLYADQVGDIVTLQAAQIHDLPAAASSVFKEIGVGMTTLDGRGCVIIDPQKISSYLVTKSAGSEANGHGSTQAVNS